MYKKFFVWFLLIALFPFSAQAHTSLLSSNPQEGENLTESLHHVELVFGTALEEGSTMSIEGEGGSFEFDDIVIQQERLIGTFTNELPNGSYQVLWNIIGEDGHPIEGEIAFGISVEANKQEIANQTAESDTVTTSQTSAERDNQFSVTWLLGLAAILAGYGIYKLVLKKK